MQANAIIDAQRTCFRCGGLAERDDSGFKCPKCGFEWATLYIKRVPKPTFLLFKEFAEAECTSDYGMALKALMDNAVANAGLKALTDSIEVLKQRIDALEAPKGKTIRLVNGTEIHTSTGGREHGKV